MTLFLIALFIAVPIAELYVIIQVGGAIGVLPTLLLLVLDSVLGWMLLRSQGRQAWLRFNLALSEGRIPGHEVFDGAMVILGGALLLTPGFITDVFGFLLLIPPTRALLRKATAVLARRRIAVNWRLASWGGGAGPTAGGAPPGAGTRRRPPASRGYDYEGSAREVPEHELEEGGNDGPA